MQGLEIFNADGTLKFSTSDRLTRILDGFYTYGGSSSRNVPGLNTGRAIVCAEPSDQTGNSFFALVPPTLSWDEESSTVSWYTQPRAQPCYITVAVF